MLLVDGNNKEEFIMIKGLAVNLQSTQGIPYTFVEIGDICRNLSIKMANITIYAFYSQDAKDSGKDPVCTNTFTCQSDKFDNYFSLDILSQADVNDVSQGYKFLEENIDIFVGSQEIIV